MESGKQTCAQCHFLMQSVQGLRLCVSESERERLLHDDWSWADEAGSLSCYRGVWNEGNGSPKDKRNETIVHTDRQSCQLFWPFKAATNFSAGEVLQDREWALEQMKRDRRLTKLVAVVAIVTSALPALAKFVLTLFTKGCP